MAISGLRGRLEKTKTETKDVTVTESDDKVALDVNIVAGGASGGATLAKQDIQIARLDSIITQLTSVLDVLAGGSLLVGVVYDAVAYSEPTTSTEVYEFYEGGLAGTKNATITISYTNASKVTLTSIVRT